MGYRIIVSVSIENAVFSEMQHRQDGEGGEDNQRVNSTEPFQDPEERVGFGNGLVKKLMNTMAMDFGVSPPSPEQMDIIFALLDRNNQGYFGE